MVVYRDIQTLARDLGIEPKTLYAVSYHRARHYRKVRIPKADGSHRRLSVPDEILKAIQRAVYRTLLFHMPISPYAAAYRFGVSLRCNAEPHCRQKRVLKLDIYRFYDHILYASVKDSVFPDRIYAEPLRVLLTMLCYDRDCLPQGAPSSPAIANIVMKDFDMETGAWCRARQIRYTRYCDDLTFSGDFDPRAVYEFVNGLLRQAGFYINRNKIVLADAGQRQLVTGLVVNDKVDVPPEYRREVRQELYYCKRFGVADHLRHTGYEGTPERYLCGLLGRLNHLLQYAGQDRKLLEERAWVMEEWRRVRN